MTNKNITKHKFGRHKNNKTNNEYINNKTLQFISYSSITTWYKIPWYNQARNSLTLKQKKGFHEMRALVDGLEITAYHEVRR